MLTLYKMKVFLKMKYDLKVIKVNLNFLFKIKNSINENFRLVREYAMLYKI